MVFRSPIFLLDGLLKSVGVGLEGAGIDDPLVDQLVTLVVRKGVEVIGFGVTHNLVCFEDLGPFEGVGFCRKCFCAGLNISIGFCLYS